ncbi:MAG: helix-turn-helix domain-containing protein [Pseudomonadales bacterium]
MSIETLLFAAIAFAVSQLVLSALLLWHKSQWAIQERLFAVLLFAIFGYLMQPLAQSEGLTWVASSISTAVPGLFWLFSASLFDDHFVLQRWKLGLVASTVLLPIIGSLLNSVVGSSPHLLLFELPQLLEFILLSLTLWVVAQHWRVDLIESRRRLRLWFCALNGVYIFALIFFREVLFPGERWLSWLQYLPVGAMLLATNALLMQYKSGVLSPAADSGQAHEQEQSGQADKTPLDRADIDIIEPLQQLMEQQVTYREMGLTIGQVAAQLEVPQYRLRTAINAGLGYRNFNDFLNSYRVKEAAKRLADPLEHKLPVLTIAMDAGFRSLSSFNKAFKDSYQLTPTAYRKQVK